MSTKSRYLFAPDKLNPHLLGHYSVAFLSKYPLDFTTYHQVENSTETTYIGIYDGYHDNFASAFVYNNLFDTIRVLAQNANGLVTEDVIREAFAQIEAAFLSYVSMEYSRNELAAVSGVSCLVGYLTEGSLLLANLGDSRAVICRRTEGSQSVVEQLTEDHNVNIEEVRQAVISEHPDDPHVVVFDKNCWKIKGICPVSRAIGLAYLKDPRYVITSPFNSCYRIHSPVVNPVVSSVPQVFGYNLQLGDDFVIFASAGLWLYISNEEAVNIVKANERSESAKSLVKAACEKMWETKLFASYQFLRFDSQSNMAAGIDFNVVVLHFDRHTKERPCVEVSSDLSRHGFPVESLDSSRLGFLVDSSHSSRLVFFGGSSDSLTLGSSVGSSDSPRHGCPRDSSDLSRFGTSVGSSDLPRHVCCGYSSDSSRIGFPGGSLDSSRLVSSVGSSDSPRHGCPRDSSDSSKFGSFLGSSDSPRHVCLGYSSDSSRIGSFVGSSDSPRHGIPGDRSDSSINGFPGDSSDSSSDGFPGVSSDSIL